MIYRSFKETPRKQSKGSNENLRYFLTFPRFYKTFCLKPIVPFLSKFSHITFNHLVFCMSFTIQLLNRSQNTHRHQPNTDNPYFPHSKKYNEYHVAFIIQAYLHVVYVYVWMYRFVTFVFEWFKPSTKEGATDKFEAFYVLNEN